MTKKTWNSIALWVCIAFTFVDIVGIFIARHIPVVGTELAVQFFFAGILGVFGAYARWKLDP